MLLPAPPGVEHLQMRNRNGTSISALGAVSLSGSIVDSLLSYLVHGEGNEKTVRAAMRAPPKMCL